MLDAAMDRPAEIKRPAASPRFASHHRADMRRWDGQSHSFSAWDGMRRDPELSFDHGECLVFLYGKGHSQRGPSFQIPVPYLLDAKCTPLLALARAPSRSSSSAIRELYLPPPQNASRQEAFHWHTTTRNFFAWVCKRPLVGKHLGPALADLHRRMHTWRSKSADNLEDLLVYADHSGYSAVENSPDHALAMLYFAEQICQRNVWIDAFTHCVGMNARLADSSELDSITKGTKAMIFRAALEMDLHLSRTTKALENFLELELSPIHLGLSTGARQHLETFRSFLQSYYVAKFGYWPPAGFSDYPKELFRSLYIEFSHLYDFIADKQSTADSQSWKSASGGICVVQNIEAFNERYRHAPLPYALPLLPATSATKDSSRAILPFKINPKAMSASRNERAKQELRSATNRTDESVSQDSLVQKYVLFEDNHGARHDEKVSVTDARKVRWILVYGMLQTLVSVLQAPLEVRDTETPAYPLCVLTNNPPWENNSVPEPLPTHDPESKDNMLQSPHGSVADLSSQTTPADSIRPDCESLGYLKHLPNHNDPNDSHTVQDKAQLIRTATRASFLRRPSRRPRRASTQSSLTQEKPQLVSGRTLAELAFGESWADSMQNSPVDAEFDFGLSQGHSNDSPSSPQVGQNSALWSTDSLHTSENWQSLPSASPQRPRQPSYEEYQTYLPSHPALGQLHEDSTGSSTPSLAYSSVSQDTISNDTASQDSVVIDVHALSTDLEHASVAMKAAKTIPAHRLMNYEELPKIPGRAPEYLKIKGAGSVRIRSIGRDEIPHSITRGYDHIKDTKDTGAKSSGEPVLDRAAVITMDGNIDHRTIDTYMAMAMA